jgi:hypothetical protein
MERHMLQTAKTLAGIIMSQSDFSFVTLRYYEAVLIKETGDQVRGRRGNIHRLGLLGQLQRVLVQVAALCNHHSYGAVVGH